jgi:lysophospholipase L1-like esterase
MRILFLGLGVVILILFLYWGIRFYQKVQVGIGLASRAVAFNNQTGDYRKTLLILGDSTGVGVGAARPEESVAGLLAAGTGSTYVENQAVSGALVAGLPAQVEKAHLAHYDTVLVQIGGNDIIRFHGVTQVSAQLSAMLGILSMRAGRVLLMSAGDVGTTTLFPPILNPFYTRLTLAYHAAFDKVARTYGARYINLYTPPAQDPFVKSPSTYFAADGLHLTSAGYALWYKRLTETVTP